MHPQQSLQFRYDVAGKVMLDVVRVTVHVIRTQLTLVHQEHLPEAVIAHDLIGGT